MSEEALSLDAAGARLWGMWHAPAGGGRAAGVFVVLHPLFEEKKAAHRVLAETARALALAGFGVLRFDLRGCGDSAGELTDASVDGWLTDARAAVETAVARADGAPLGFFGLRFGGALACRAALAYGAARWVVLWEPALRGRAYLMSDLRKKLVREMMTFGESRGSRASLEERLRTEPWIDYDGFPITGALFDGIAGLDVSEDAAHLSSRILAVQVSPTGTVGAGLRKFAELGGARAAAVGLKGIPFWNTVGVADGGALIDTTLDWLRSKKD